MRGALRRTTQKTRRIHRRKRASQRAGKHSTVRNVLRQAEQTAVGPTPSVVGNVFTPTTTLPLPATETEAVVPNRLTGTVTNFLTRSPSVSAFDTLTQQFNNSLDRVLITMRRIDKPKLADMMVSAMGYSTLPQVFQAVRDAVSSVYEAPASCDERRGWVPCKDRCDATIRALMTAELNSTAYMLRALTESVLTVEGGVIEFEPLIGLTGRWDIDHERIRITRLGLTPPTYISGRARGRLIMGFGPSASGKTHWAKTILTLMSSANPAFPKTMLSIDGGLYRQTSIIYRAVLEEAKRICVEGFDNLVLARWELFRSSLFNSDNVKAQIVEYLLRQTVPISLYVPETLGDCGRGRPKSCVSKYSPYMAVTGDRTNWIGLLIWQHKTAADCTATDAAHRCKGCTESGEERQRDEGKKYSNGSYDHSMSEGEKAIRSAPGGQYKIHNGGGPGKISVLTDYTTYTETTRPIQDALRAAQGAHSFEYEVRV